MKSVLIGVLLMCSSAAIAQENIHFEKANTAFNEQRPDEAFIYLKSALAQQPDHLPSKILMGQILALSFYYQDAIYEFEEVLERGADPNLVMNYLANSLLFVKDYDGVLALPETGLSRSNKASLALVKGRAHYEMNKKVAAKSAFDYALKLAPNDSAVMDALAKFHLNENEPDKAAHYAELAIALNSNNSEAYRSYAIAMKQSGDIDAAIKYIETGLALSPEQPLLLREAASLYMQVGDISKANRVLETILASAPDDPMAKFLKSWVNRELGNNDVADEVLADVVNYLSLVDDTTLKNSSGLLLVTAMSNYMVGNMEAAKQKLDRYLELNPNDRNALLIRAEIYEKERAFVQAAKVVEPLREVALSDLPLADRLCDLYILAKQPGKCVFLVSKMGPSHQKEPLYIAITAKSLAARGRFQEAFTLIDTLPSEVTGVLVDKAKFAMKAGYLKRASTIIETLVARHPTENDILNMQASVLLKMGGLDKGEKVLDVILSKNPAHVSARFNKAKLLLAQKQHKAAFVVAQSLYVENDKDPYVLLMMADAKAAIGDTDEALHYLSIVNTVDASNVDAKLKRFTILRGQGELDAALLVVDELVEKHFLSVDYLALRAGLLVQMGLIDRATEDYAVLFGVVVDSPVDLKALSDLQLAIGDVKGALRSIERAIELNNTVPGLYRNKAFALLKMGQLDAASAVLSENAAYFSNTADRWSLLGDVAAQRGQYDVAADYYNRAVSASPRFLKATLKQYELAKRGYGEQAFLATTKAISATPNGSGLQIGRAHV